MRIGFFLGRATHLKTLGSLIQHSINQKHTVELFYENPKRGLGNKSYQIVRREQLSPFGLPGNRLIAVDDFAQLLRVPTPDILVVHEGFHTLGKHLEGVTSLRDMKKKIISVMHFFETAQRPLQALDLFDLTVYPSEFGRNLHFDLQCSIEKRESEKEKRKRQYLVAGEPMFDQIGTISRQQARKKLNISDSARVVLFIAPVISLATPWRFFVWAKNNKMQQTREIFRMGKPQYLAEVFWGPRFDQVVDAIRRFCSRNSALLIVKSRGKQKSFPYLQHNADLFFDGFDDVYFPLFTTYLLLAAADLCITVNSMAAVEAVATNVPCINIYVPHLDFAQKLNQKRRRYVDILLSGRQGSLMNYEGCVTRVDRRNIVTWMDEKNLSGIHIDHAAQNKYSGMFLGIEKQTSSERILRALGEFVRR